MADENANDVEDNTQTDLNAEPTPPTPASDGEKPTEAAAAEAKPAGDDKVDLAKTLEAAGLDISDPEALTRSIVEMQNISTEAGGIEGLKDLQTAAKEMGDTKSAWKLQEEIDKRKEEEPAETIERLDKERLEGEQSRRAESDKATRGKEAQDAIKTFDSTTKSVIDSAKDASDAEKSLLKKLLSSENGLTEVTLTDKAAVTKLVSEQGKWVSEFKAQVIQDYVDGKEKIPKVDESIGAGFDKKGPKNLKEAEKGAHAYIRQHLPNLAKLLPGGK